MGAGPTPIVGREPAGVAATAPADKLTIPISDNKQHARHPRQEDDDSPQVAGARRHQLLAEAAHKSGPLRPQARHRRPWRRRWRPSSGQMPAHSTVRSLPSHLAALVLALLVALVAQQVGSFNVDPHSAIVHSGPSGTYFGYSVAQHTDRGSSWLLVGAPKAQTDQPGVVSSGAVFRCSASASTACQPIHFDRTGSARIKIKDKPVQSDDKSHQWFGASLASANDNGSIIACAPNYVYFSQLLNRRDPVGTCWVSRGSFDGFLEYSPCRQLDQWGHHNLGSCQAGFSSAITRDGSRVFMGAPGAHVWQGQVFSPNLTTHLMDSTSSMNPHSEDDAYLGYSLALGRFSARTAAAAGTAAGAELVDLAIGIPRANELAGKIMLVDREMRLLRNITGEQLGSYFGYSLAAADVNGDGLDDLVIGAPLFYNQTTSHKETNFDRGRVYVALQNARHELQLANRLDGAQRNRARFGTAVANCGDLNRDGFQDVAVGAPYDGPEHHGAVYIYMGRKGGLVAEFDQVIYAESVRGEGGALRAFGFALSAGLDLDNNHYPDLLVGDYQADRAVLLRSRPVVNVTSSLLLKPDHFNLEERSCLLANTGQNVSCVTAEYCLKYSGLQVDSRLGFVHEIKLDTEARGEPRLFFLNNEARNEERTTSTLTKDVAQCRSFRAYIKSQVRDKLTPLRIDIDYSLAEAHAAESAAAPGAKLRPILNRATGNRLSRVVNIQKNCGADNVCVPDLRLTVTPNIEQYTIGSSDKIVLDVRVKNYGEDAFESMFYLTMPMSINFNKIDSAHPNPPVCNRPKPDETGTNVLVCDLGNPQAAGELVRFSVITEPARSVFTSPDFNFLAQVNSTNPERNERARDDNQALVEVRIKVEVQLVISGSSQPAFVLHNSTRHQSLRAAPGAELVKPIAVSESDIGPEVSHNYVLQNRGPSTINDIALSILWPTKTKDGDYLLYLVDEPTTSDKVRCKPAPGEAINPLGLKYHREQVPLPSDASKRQYRRQAPTAPDATGAPPGATLAQSSRPATTTTTATSTATTAATTTVDNSVLQQMNLLACGPTQCTRFECNVFDLGSNEAATIKIKSRLYEETINELSIQEFDISSKLVAQIKALPYNVSTQTMPPYVHKVETQVRTTGLAPDLPWWLIVLAILLGILLFALLACLLNYLGFFARKRPPKGPEREPLTPTIWNDYKYTPGDTAL